MPFGIQPLHIVIIVIVALIIFGPKRLPEVGRWVGRTLNEFRKGTQEMTEALREESVKAAREENLKAAMAAQEQDNTIAKPAPTQSIPVNAKFCINCGAPNPSEALFCNKCGSQFPV